jgi:tetratricopeptide (TPR) repeat protein
MLMTQTDQTSAEARIAHDIADRTRRAINSDQPLFLIVYYEHESAKFAFIRAMQEALRDAGLTARIFDPAHRPEHGAGKLYGLLATVDRSKTLSIISGFPCISGSATPDPYFLEYLNLHRDRLASDRLRFILFLHTAEAESFISGAGDLWDFRHHTYWLEGAPEPGKSLWRKVDQFQKIQMPEANRSTIKTHIENVHSLIDQTPNPEEKAALFLDLSRWLSYRHSLSLAAEAAMAGLQLISSDSSRLQADLEHELGFSLQKDRDFPDALNHYHNCLAIRRKIGDRSGEGSALHNISQIYKAWGKNEEALKMMEESLAIRRKTGDHLGEGEILNNMSEIFFLQQRHDEALQCLKDSLVIQRETGIRSGEGPILNNISAIYYVRGQHGEALKALEESLAICLEIGDRFGEGKVLSNMSQIYTGWGRYDEALKVLEESLAIFGEIGNLPGESETCLKMAFTYAQKGDLENAIKLTRRSVEIR